MSDIKLFQTKGDGTLAELGSAQVRLEKTLQLVFEANLDALLGVRFLASEYSISGGRMDTLGIDKKGYPVIVEYKRKSNENVIGQGLTYLNWLTDHRGDFEILVRDRFGKEEADKINWNAPRLVCIAADFNKFDFATVKMGSNIELVRYRRFGEDLLMLELLTEVPALPKPTEIPAAATRTHQRKTISDSLEAASEELANLVADVEAFMFNLGDDVNKKTFDFYFSFRRKKKFADMQIRRNSEVVRLWLKLNPDTIDLKNGFTRDVRGVGHHGTGDLEVTIRSHDDLERAKPLIIRSYEGS